MLSNIRRDCKIQLRTQNYLGCIAMMNYRFGVWAAKLSFAPLRWLFSKLYAINSIFSEAICGIHLGRDTQIGEDLHFIHSGCINIHDASKIGNRVGIMHGVTLGAGSENDAPIIEDDAFLGAHATIIGGVTIGKGARVAANSLVLNNVPAGCMAIGVPAKNVPQIGMIGKKKPEKAKVDKEPLSTKHTG